MILHRLFAGLGGLVVIVLFAMLIAPYFIDWTVYKHDFEREASRITGHDVESLGRTDVRLLPLPSVRFNGLAVGKNADGGPIMTADQFVINIELMPLLKGEIRIVNPTLIRPRIKLYLDKKGVPIWPERRKFSADPERISLENFTVVNAEIKIHESERERVFSLEQIDGILNAKSLYGPWFIKADGYVQGKRTHVKISTGHVQDSGSMRVNLTAQRFDLPYNLSLGGNAWLDGESLRWDGEYELAMQNGSQDRISGNGNRGKQFFPVFSHGKFGATMSQIEIPKFSLEIGEGKNPYKIIGSGSIKTDGIPGFQIKANGGQINLDQAETDPGNDSASIVSEKEGMNPERYFSVLRRFLKRTSVLPVGGVVALSLPAIVIGGAPIREVDMVISSDSGEWEIKRLNGLLPGSTKFEAQGKIDLHPVFSFKGSALLSSRNPSEFATWLGYRNASIGKLRSAGFMGDVVLSENEINLENLRLILDKTVLVGSLRRLATGKGNVRIVTQLDGEEVHLDDLQAFFAFMTGWDAGLTSGTDLNVDLQVEKLSGFGVSAEKLNARFSLSGKSVSVEKLEVADFLGVSFSSLGGIKNFPERPDGSFELKVKSQDASRLARFIQLKLFRDSLPKRFFQSGLPGEDIDLVFSINARSNDVLDQASKGQISVKGKAGESRLEIMAGFEGTPEVPETLLFDIASTLENENPTKLLMQLGLPVLPIDVAGPLTLTGSFIGSLKNGFDTLVTAQMPETGFLLSGKAYPAGNNAGATFKARLGIQDIAPFALLSGIGGALQIFSDRTVPASFTGNLKLGKNRIDLDNGEGQIGGQEFSLDLVFERRVSSNNRVNGKLVADSLSLPFLARMILADGTMDAGENWSQENFGQPLLQGLDGEIELNVGRSDFGVGKYAKNIKGKLEFSDDSINLNNIRGEWLEGSFIANLSLSNDGEKGVLGAQYAFRNISTRSVSGILKIPDFISANMNVEGELEGGGHSPAAIVSSLMGSGTIDLRDVKIFHFNDSPLKSVFTAVDKKGFEINDESILQVLTGIIDRGEVAMDAISFPYIVEAGTFRARNIFSRAEKVSMVGAARIDIAHQIVDSELSVRFDSGKHRAIGKQPEIAMTWKGSLRTPVRRIDVRELSGFLLLRKLDREQRQADLLQGLILEENRLQRDSVLSRSLTTYRQHLREKELYRKRQELLKRKEDRLHEMTTRRHRELLAKESVAEDR